MTLDMEHMIYWLFKLCHVKQLWESGADSAMDSHTSGPGFKTRLARYFLPSFRLTTTISV